MVIAIIGILAAMLLPVLGRAKSRGKRVACTSNLHQIGLAAWMYQEDHDGMYHHRKRDGKAEIPNHGQWTANPLSGVILSPDHDLAYWGVAYLPYVGGGRRVFRCASAKATDAWREDGLTYPLDYWLNSSYGINRYVVEDPSGVSLKARKVSSFRFPASTILAQDAAEQRMEGPDDSWGLFEGKSENLSQWRYGLAYLYPETKIWMEYFRHDSYGQAVWLDGHVSALRSTPGCDYRWYTGVRPSQTPPD